MKRILQIGSAFSALFVLLLMGLVLAMVAAAWETFAAVGAILAWVVLALASVAGCAWLVSFVFRRLSKIDISRSEAMRERIETEQARDRRDFERAVMVATLPQIQAGLLFPGSVGDIPFSAHTKALPKNDGVPFLGEPNVIRPILPELVQRQRVLIVGASDSGKTTLLRHLIDAKGNCLVIDPHGTPPKWGKAKHIGQGRDYKAIGASLTWLIREMDKRYEQLGTGEVKERTHDQVTVIIDEWRAIVKHVKTAGEQISTLLTEGRKVNLDLIVATHSQMVKALGIEGEGDLRKGFTVVNLSGGNGEPHRATLSTNAGDPVEYALPGPYNEQTFNEQIAVKLLPAEVETMERAGTILDLNVAPETEQDFIDQQVIEARNRGESWSACYRIYHKLTRDSEPPTRPSAAQIDQVKEICAKWGAK